MTQPPAAAMMGLITGAWVTQAVYVAARLGVADVIAAEGPRSPGELAERLDADADALYRVLRALAAVGVFAERDDGAFTMTPLADCLRSDAPGSLRAFAIMMGGEGVWRSWGEVLHSVRTGERDLRDHGAGGSADDEPVGGGVDVEAVRRAARLVPPAAGSRRSRRRRGAP
jgi:hypothetical protein